MTLGDEGMTKLRRRRQAVSVYVKLALCTRDCLGVDQLHRRVQTISYHCQHQFVCFAPPMKLKMDGFR